jgi:hypothetical protein
MAGVLLQRGAIIMPSTGDLFEQVRSGYACACGNRIRRRA